MDDKITVYVGKDKTKFVLSRKRLQPILPHIELEDYDSHRLPDVGVKTFKLFQTWLCNGTLKKLDYDTDTQDNSDKDAKATMLEYFDLYFEATEWKIQDLENTIMDRFRERYKCEDGYFPCFLIRKVYDGTEPGSPLRRYIVDSYVYKNGGWDPDTQAQSFHRHSEKGNNDFLFDCYRASLVLAEDNVVDADCHDGTPGCKYHQHRDGQTCGLEHARKKRKIG